MLKSSDKYAIVIFLLIMILITIFIILYKVSQINVSSDFTHLTKSEDVNLMPYKYSHGIDISLLQWNIHYECFVNNKDADSECCSGPVIKYLNNKLIGSPQIDFANLTMFESKNYSPPNGFKMIGSYTDSNYICGRDGTALIYNSERWRPDGDAIHGCIIPTPIDRAFIIQKFIGNNDKNKNISLYIIGAHFSHPPEGSYYPQESLDRIKDTLKRSNISVESNIILLADTNDSDPSLAHETPDSVFMNGITNIITPNQVIGTGPVETCCCSDTPQTTGLGPFPYKTDRIIANFGKSNGPAILGDPVSIVGGSQCSVPNPTGCLLGEMHKPVFWSLQV
jgi:hypothetical protein